MVGRQKVNDLQRETKKNTLSELMLFFIELNILKIYFFYPVHFNDDTRHGAVVAKGWVLASRASSQHALSEGTRPLGVLRCREGVLDEVLPLGAVIVVTLLLLGVVVG